jgi:hypothetical protein
MHAEMTTERLCRKLNRLLKTKSLDEVLDRLGDRCEEVHRDEKGVTEPANWYAIGDHAVAYLRWHDEFVPVRRMGSIPQEAFSTYDTMGIEFN